MSDVKKNPATAIAGTNRLCADCRLGCKQDSRAVVVSCPKYQRDSQREEKSVQRVRRRDDRK